MVTFHDGLPVGEQGCTGLAPPEDAGYGEAPTGGWSLVLYAASWLAVIILLAVLCSIAG